MIAQQVEIKVENVDKYPFDKILREIASTMNAEILNRIHNQQLKADGSLIGTYKNYPDSYYITKKIKEGRNKQGNRVNLSYTAQSLPKLTVVAENGRYGLGWNNPTVFDIAEGNEKRYGIIYAHTDDELKMIEELAANLMRDALLRETNSSN